MAEDKKNGKDREKENRAEQEMPMAQALAERNLLIKRIFDATDDAQFVGTVRKAEERSVAKRIENARF